VGLKNWLGLCEMSACVLVIDDDPIVCTTVQHVLGRAGHEVHTASNFSQALDLVESHRFDLVITDLVMPDVDGVTVILAFKGQFPEMPLIAMSGGARFGTSDSLAAAKEAGADEILRKPFSAEAITTLVATVLKQRGTPQD
jgi:DNA-binding NtrC family response regulator